MASNLSTSRVAIITGAAQGIGEAIALRLADEGVDIALLDIPPKVKELLDVAEKIKEKGRRVIHITADVAQEEQVKAAVETCVQELGSLDIVRFSLQFDLLCFTYWRLQMIANAGILHLGTILDSKPLCFSHCCPVQLLIRIRL